MLKLARLATQAINSLKIKEFAQTVMRINTMTTRTSSANLVIHSVMSVEDPMNLIAYSVSQASQGKMINQLVSKFLEIPTVSIAKLLIAISKRIFF